MLVNTWTATMLADGATPVIVALRPAAMPATWVPWEQSSVNVQGRAAPVPTCWYWLLGQRVVSPPEPPASEKQASAATRPPRNGCEASVPVSRTATAQPAPVAPAVWACGPFTSGTLSARTG